MKSKMCIAVSVYLIIIIGLSELKSQNYKGMALKEFDLQHYTTAIELMNRALEKDSSDAEIYYYLGYFTHYLSFDSRPIDYYDFYKHSDKVLKYLEKAISINPEYGDAHYFIGAECGARFEQALQRKNLKLGITELKKGKEKGGYPEWLLEYARNTLRVCDDNSIIVVDGDAIVNGLFYVQIVEKFRPDVIVIIHTFLERPWYLMLLKNGLDGYLSNVPFSWNEEQIMDIHLSKWDTTSIKIPICNEIVSKYNIKNDFVPITITPNLKSNNSQYLSSKYTALLNILIANQWKRPVYMLPYLVKDMILDSFDYFENNGLLYKFIPFKTIRTDFEINYKKLETILCDKENFVNLNDVVQHDMPRVSSLLQNYISSYYYMINYFVGTKDYQKANEIINKMEKIILPYLIHTNENVIKMLTELKNEISKKLKN